MEKRIRKCSNFGNMAREDLLRLYLGKDQKAGRKEGRKVERRGGRRKERRKRQARHISGVRAFQVEGTMCFRILRWKHARCVGQIERTEL